MRNGSLVLNQNQHILICWLSICYKKGFPPDNHRNILYKPNGIHGPKGLLIHTFLLQTLRNFPWLQLQSITGTGSNSDESISKMEKVDERRKSYKARMKVYWFYFNIP